MDVLESIGLKSKGVRFKPDPVPRVLTEKLLAAGARAPDYHRLRPWRFIVVQGKTRDRMADAMVQAKLKSSPNLTVEQKEVARTKALKSPLIIVVAADKAADPTKAGEVGTAVVAAAAAQNIMLAAQAEGLIAKWRAGRNAIDPDVKASLGLSSDQHLVAFLYLGYQAPQEASGAENPSNEPPGPEDRTIWTD